MRKEINKTNKTQNTQNIPQLEVVVNKSSQVQVEIEIENHVKSIRALIRKLRPQERQKYFNGLLSHLLTAKVEYPLQNVNASQLMNHSEDFQALSQEHLELIREMSCKLQDLYVRSGDAFD